MITEQLKPIRLRTSLCYKCDRSIEKTALSVPIGLVHAGILPTENEAASIRHVIATEKKAIRDFDLEIERAQRYLRDLRDRQRILRTHLERKRALLSPIARLPSEVLSIIIEMAIMRTFRRKRDSTVVKRHAVLRVCQRWRNIALAIPHLWANIILYPTYDPGFDGTLVRCTQRSRALPLDLCMKRTKPYWRQAHNPLSLITPDPRVQWNRAEDALVACADRWRTIRLDDWEGYDVLEKEATFPHLTELRLAFGSAHPINLFKDSPALVDVQLERIHLPELHLPWQQLQRLSIRLWESSTVRHYGQVLAQCANLVSLTLTAFAFDANETHPLVRLPKLESATLYKKAHTFLSWLIAPELRQLVIHSDTIEDEVEHTHFLFQFILQNTTIDELNLSYLSLSLVDATAWVPLLQYLHTVTHLRIVDDWSHSQISLDVINFLAHQFDELPKLARLELPSLRVIESVVEDTVEMLFERRPLELEVDVIADLERLKDFALEKGGKISEAPPSKDRSGRPPWEVDVSDVEPWERGSAYSSDTDRSEDTNEIRTYNVKGLKTASECEDDFWGGGEVNEFVLSSDESDFGPYEYSDY
ncbi:hypothetical protein GGG16DRAFT_116752 [Schizophyllum commune]